MTTNNVDSVLSRINARKEFNRTLHTTIEPSGWSRSTDGNDEFFGSIDDSKVWRASIKKERAIRGGMTEEEYNHNQLIDALKKDYTPRVNNHAREILNKILERNGMPQRY